MRLIHKTSIAGTLMLFTTLAAGAWGQKGHDTVAYIGEQHLTAAAKDSVAALLDGKSPVYWANWLDNASHTPEYAYSKTWHYKNIDADQTYESAPKNYDGDIVRALQDQIKVLQNTSAPREKRVLALKMIIHFMGDLHQPMHMGHASDLGGNRVTVKYFNNKRNLHSVWDSSLPESAHKWSYTEWQQQIDRATPEEIIAIQAGDIDDWAQETYAICKDVYTQTPENYTISYDYIAQWTPVIEQQFLRGGLRLADILNAIFDAEYTPNSKSVK